MKIYGPNDIKICCPNCGEYLQNDQKNLYWFCDCGFKREYGEFTTDDIKQGIEKAKIIENKSFIFR